MFDNDLHTELVKVNFDPTDDLSTRKVFRNHMARVLYLGIRPCHLVDQYYTIAEKQLVYPETLQA